MKMLNLHPTNVIYVKMFVTLSHKNGLTDLAEI